MCEFESLYFDRNGYVICCKRCRHYQIAFLSTLLTLDERDFQVLRNIVGGECGQPHSALADDTKSVIIRTPSKQVCIFLTQQETGKFHKMLDEADSEAKSLSLINSINSATH